MVAEYFFDTAMELGVEGITVCVAGVIAYHPRPRGRMCSSERQTPGKQLFRNIFSRSPAGPRGKTPLVVSIISALFLDFPGRQSDLSMARPWSNPTYNLFGLAETLLSVVPTRAMRRPYKALIEDTEWGKESTASGKNPRCDNCMAHCGFEGTAVNDAFSNPFKALVTSLRRPPGGGVRWPPELPFRIQPDGLVRALWRPFTREFR